MSSEKLTHTQDLIMEVLSARDRLNEPVWTFAKRHKRALLQLQDMGLVSFVKSGFVQDTVVTSITQDGRERYQVKPYGPLSIFTHGSWWR